MNASVATNKFKSLLRDILANTTIKLGKVLSKFIYNCVETLVSIRGRVNFLQLKRHSSMNEKTFRNNFSKEVDWVGINDEVALRELPDAAHQYFSDIVNKPTKRMETIKITRYKSPVGEMILGSYRDKLCICDWGG